MLQCLNVFLHRWRHAEVSWLELPTCTGHIDPLHQRPVTIATGIIRMMARGRWWRTSDVTDLGCKVVGHRARWQRAKHIIQPPLARGV